MFFGQEKKELKRTVYRFHLSQRRKLPTTVGTFACKPVSIVLITISGLVKIVCKQQLLLKSLTFNHASHFGRRHVETQYDCILLGYNCSRVEDKRREFQLNLGWDLEHRTPNKLTL